MVEDKKILVGVLAPLETRSWIHKICRADIEIAVMSELIPLVQTITEGMCQFGAIIQPFSQCLVQRFASIRTCL